MTDIRDDFEAALEATDFSEVDDGLVDDIPPRTRRPSHPTARGTVMGERTPVLDASCYCAKCTTRTSEMYDLRGACTNCGQTFTVRARKGDKAPLSVECPACEVTVYGWRAIGGTRQPEGQ
jgi:hypothetical protein